MRWILFLLLLSAPALAQSPQQNVQTPAQGNAHFCATDYPPSAVRAHVQGVTTVDFLVTAAGAVANVTVKKSSGHSSLDDASVRCVLQWVYAPTMKDGVAIEVSKEANVSWSLDGPDPVPDFVLFMIESAVQECVGKAGPSDDVLAKATGMTVVKVQFGNDRPPSVDVTTSSGSAELDKLVVDCLGQLHPPIRTAFIIPFSWKADALASPSSPPAGAR